MGADGRCAIVGGGIGGLTCAAYLASMGYEVDLFEQEKIPGGKALRRSSGEFTFDGGPTLFTMPFVLDMMASETGGESGLGIPLIPLEETCRYFYPDGTTFRAYADRARLYDEVARTMKDPPERMSDYLSHCKRIYDLCSDLFLFSSFHELDMLLEHRDMMSPFQVPELDFIRTMHRANKSFFKDRRLLQYADRFATFNGSDPYRVPGTLNIIHHVEGLGASVPAEGIAAIPERLREYAASKGARIHTGVPVSRIALKDRKVAGVVTPEGFLPYRTVVSNVDVSTTYRTLLRRERNIDAFKYRMMSPSSSAIVWYWGVRVKEESLSVHNVLFPARYAREFRDLFSRGRCPRDPTVYIYVSSKYNPSHAPEGHENWYVMMNAPSIRRQDWEAEIARARERVVAAIRERLGIDVDSLLVSEEVLTPDEIRSRTGSHRGSIYGISSNNMFSAFLRQGNRSRIFEGLYFCGGSSHPGGGIPLALLSGRMAAKLVDRKGPR